MHLSRLLAVLLFLLLDLVISLKPHKYTLCSHTDNLRATRCNRRKRMCSACTAITIISYRCLKSTPRPMVHLKRGACISFIPINRSMHFFFHSITRNSMYTTILSIYESEYFPVPLLRMDFLLKLEYFEFIFCFFFVKFLCSFFPPG